MREVQIEDCRVRGREAILEFLRTTDVGRKFPAEKATEVESSESGTEQECRGESACAGCAVRFPKSNFPTLYLLFGRQSSLTDHSERG